MKKCAHGTNRLEALEHDRAPSATDDDESGRCCGEAERSRNAARRGSDGREGVGEASPRESETHHEPSCRGNPDAFRRGEDPVRRRCFQACNAPQFRGDLDGVRALKRPGTERITCAPGCAEPRDDVRVSIGPQGCRIDRAGKCRLVSRRRECWIEGPTKVRERDANGAGRRQLPGGVRLRARVGSAARRDDRER